MPYDKYNFDDVFDHKEYANLCLVENIQALSAMGDEWRNHWESIKNKGIVR